MMCLVQPLVNRSVVKLDLTNKEHRAFMFDLGMVCKAQFLNDAEPDIIPVMNEYARMLEAGTTQAFICLEEGKKAGIIWVEFDRYGVGYLRAGLLPEYRKGWTALYFLRQFIEFCFNTAKLRKLVANVEPANQAAEKILRRLGFKKQGMDIDAVVVDGKPVTFLVLFLTPKNYRHRVHTRKHERQKVRKKAHV